MTMQQDRHRQDRGRAARARPSMRKLTGAVFLSLDGVMQAPGGPGRGSDRRLPLRRLGPALLGREHGPVRARSSAADYDLLLGKRTYDIFAAYWPYNQDNPIGAKFQRINKYVLTHSDEPLAWENSHKLSGDTAEAVAELKQSEGRDLLIQGSSTLYPPLLAAGLIDRLVADDLPGRAGRGQAHLRRIGRSPARSSWSTLRLGQGRRLRDLRAGRRGADRHLRDQAAERGRARAAARNRRRGAGEPATLRPPVRSPTCQKVLIAL